eukprot:s1306_g12.t1
MASTSFEFMSTHAVNIVNLTLNVESLPHGATLRFVMGGGVGPAGDDRNGRGHAGCDQGPPPAPQLLAPHTSDDRLDHDDHHDDDHPGFSDDEQSDHQDVPKVDRPKKVKKDKKGKKKVTDKKKKGKSDQSEVPTATSNLQSQKLASQQMPDTGMACTNVTLSQPTRSKCEDMSEKDGEPLTLSSQPQSKPALRRLSRFSLADVQAVED